MEATLEVDNMEEAKTLAAKRHQERRARFFGALRSDTLPKAAELLAICDDASETPESFQRLHAIYLKRKELAVVAEKMDDLKAQDSEVMAKHTAVAEQRKQALKKYDEQLQELHDKHLALMAQISSADNARTRLRNEYPYDLTEEKELIAKSQQISRRISAIEDGRVFNGYRNPLEPHQQAELEDLNRQKHIVDMDLEFFANEKLAP